MTAAALLSARTLAADPLWRIAIGVVAGLTVLRIAAIVADPNALYADETQYWIWSRELAWGYFSKPPMIAWIIAATTGVFGNADWAVRLAAPLLHAGTALCLGLAARRMVSAQAGAWAAIVWITLPSVWLSASVITTDGPLLFFWSAGLYALARLRDGAGAVTAAALGLAAGLGFLSKYAMIYFALGIALAVLIDAPSRRALLGPKGLLAAAIAVALLAPNLVWNAQNGFATVSHTAANANWGGSLFNAGELATFLIDQLGVFGPALFPALIAAIIAAVRNPGGAARPRLMLVGFIAPALVIVAFQAFISRAHANWAASAYAGGTILVTVLLLEGPRWRRWVLKGSIAAHSIAGMMLLLLAASPPLAEAAGLSNAFKRVRAWDETMERLARAAQRAEMRAGVTALVFDNRNDFHQAQRYGEAIDLPLYMWVRFAGPSNHAEAGWALPDGYDAPVLVVSERPGEVALIEGDFAHFTRFGEIVIDHGGNRPRRYQLFIAQGHERETRDAAYEAAVADARERD